MKKILLVLSYSGFSGRAIDEAVRRARKEKATLSALYLLEGGAAESVFDKFSDIGFIGDRPSEDLSRTVMKESRQLGYEALGKVQIKAMEEGVDFEPLVEEDATVEKVLSVIEKINPAAVYVLKRKQRAFFKYFTRSLADELAERASCEVAIITEEGEQEKEGGNAKDMDRK
jgi:nucleotide-binding universal stress UspA family protein